MSDLSEFFFGSSPAVYRIQAIEISHPSFSTTYRVMRNIRNSVALTHEGPAGPFTYSYFPMKIRVVGSGNGLEQSLEVVFGDVGQVLPNEIANMLTSNTINTKPILRYREYRSDDLTAPLTAPQVFEITTMAFNKTGAVISAKPPAFNRTRTGELYTIEKFPMLRGFV